VAQLRQPGFPSGPDDADSSGDDQEDEDEGGTFAELDPSSRGSVDGSCDAAFGPLAILAVGLPAEEHAALAALLIEMGADELQLIPCTAAMLGGSLGEALEAAPPPPHEPPRLGARRVLFLSGMYAAEVMEVVAAVRASPALPEGVVFAAAVPRSWGRVVVELVEDVAADAAAAAARRAAAALEAARAEAGSGA
jgi:hypothetical protein